MLNVMFPFKAVQEMLVVEKKLKLRKEFFINSFSANVPIEFHTLYTSFYVRNPCKCMNKKESEGHHVNVYACSV